jgi:hydroxymethylglutaryl-CoA lyase
MKQQIFPSRVTLIEVGPRDGLQTQPKYVPVDKKLELIERSIAAGLKRIQVTSFVHPRLVPQMADAEELCARLPQRDDVQFNGLILNLRGLDRAHKAGLKHIDTGVPASETLSQKNANSSIAEGMQRMQEIVEKAHGYGMSVRGGVQTAFGCVYEGAIAQARVVSLCETFLAMGVDELTLADSAGLGNPLQMKQMLHAIMPLAGDTPVVLHLHDTRGMGIANLYAALECGVRYFDTSFGGLGGCPFIEGAKGNIATEDSVNMLNQLGIETGIDIAQVGAISRDLETFFGQELPAKLHHLV